MIHVISLELLSDVLGKEVTSSVLIEDDDCTHNKEKLLFQFKDTYYGGNSGIEDEEINIYELAHKCKEWAIEKDYLIRSFKNWNEDVKYFAVVHVRMSSSLCGVFTGESKNLLFFFV